MDADEFKNWIAFFALENQDYKSKIALENQKTQSLEEEAEKMRAMLSGLGK